MSTLTGKEPSTNTIFTYKDQIMSILHFARTFTLLKSALGRKLRMNLDLEMPVTGDLRGINICLSDIGIV